MKRSIPALLLCAVTLCLLFACAGSAYADSINPNTYPGADPEGTSYWAQCEFNSGWGPNDGMNVATRFSIAGAMGYIGEKFTWDPDRKLEDSAVKYKSAVEAYMGLTSSEVITYNTQGIDAGFVFEQVEAGAFKIRTADGDIWLKRSGGSTNYSLIATDSVNSATTFHVKAELTNFLIYEDPDSGTGYYGIVLKNNSLSLKYYSRYDDIKSIPLYRRAYCPDCYLHGDFALWGDPQYVPANAGGLVYYGPYTYSDTRQGSSPQPVKLPCYYREISNLGMLDNGLGTLVAIPCVEGVTIKVDINTPPPEYYYKEELIGWRILMPDAPSTKNRELYFLVPVVFQEHDFKTHNNQVGDVLYSTADCWVTGKEPTCTEDGYRYRPCMNYVNWESGPDQSEWGLDGIFCHEYQVSEAIPATGHTIETVTYRGIPTCEMGAYIQGPCTKCGQKNARIDDPSQPALGHDLELRPAKAPTCTEEGNEAYYICVRSVCNWTHTGYYMTDVNGTRIYHIPTIPVDPDAHAYENRLIYDEETGILTAARVCTRCGDVESSSSITLAGHGTADDPWQIGSAAIWDFFSSALESGFDVTGMCFLLTDDISVSTTMGTSEHPFSGSFDGGGRTLSVSLACSSGYVAPFAHVSGASFTNLKTDGTITVTGGTASGLAGSAPGGCTVTNCLVDVDIVGSGGSGHTGFVAMCNSSNPVSVFGSAFTGSIIDPHAGYCAGFLGWAGNKTDYCVYDGTMNAGSNSNDFIRTNNYSNNCYYTNADGIVRIKGSKALPVYGPEGLDLNFGQSISNACDVSCIVPCPIGLFYNSVFYCAPNRTVTISLPAGADRLTTLLLADAGTLTETAGGWSLVMPGETGVTLSVETLSPTLVLPDNLSVLEAEAFAGDTLITVVDARHCAALGAEAFRGCTGLTRIRLPQDCEIGESAFDGCGPICVFAPAGGRTETWCTGRPGVAFFPETLDD